MLVPYVFLALSHKGSAPRAKEYMKSMKVFYMDKKLCEVYPYATKWQVMKYRAYKFGKHTLRLSLISGLGYVAFMAGAFLNPITTFATVEKVVEVEKNSPVMDRIQKCESPTGHYKNGQVVTRANKNGTVDTGAFQINSVWNETATKLGLDLTKEEDNKTMAYYLYRHYGTEPWVYSKSCWNK